MKLSENHTTILSTYTQWLQMLGFSASIVYGYPKMVSHFLVWLQQNGIFGITQLNTNHLHHYYTYLENRPNQKVAGRGLSAAHLNKNFDAVDKLCECLHHMGMDQAPSPTQYRLAYKYSERPSVLTQQEFATCMGRSRIRLRTMVWLPASPGSHFTSGARSALRLRTQKE